MDDSHALFKNCLFRDIHLDTEVDKETTIIGRGAAIHAKVSADTVTDRFNYAWSILNTTDNLKPPGLSTGKVVNPLNRPITMMSSDGKKVI